MKLESSKIQENSGQHKNNSYLWSFSVLVIIRYVTSDPYA